jgi:pyruvate formate lyase activating enzyme
MMDRPRTPSGTLTRARQIAIDNGLRYAYTGNVHDREGDSTYCHHCGKRLIGRDWYVLTSWNLTPDGRCPQCHTPCAGILESEPGTWGARRQPVRLANYRV